MSKKRLDTKTIWDMIQDGASPDELETVISGGMSFHDYMYAYLEEHQELSEAQITRNANMSKSTVNDIINDRKKGSRDKILAICYGAHMTVNETEYALLYSGNNKFYPQLRRDMLLVYAFNNQKKYPTITDVNIYLSENGEAPLQTSKQDA